VPPRHFVGGNVANGDPGNGADMTLGANYRLEGTSGGRDVAASGFQGLFHRARAGEILTAI
jgi:carbon-monoxide dehydrogenase medium subunit